MNRPTVEQFFEWLETKKPGEKIGPDMNYFNDDTCQGCALGQFVSEKFGVNSLAEFRKLMGGYGRFLPGGIDGWAFRVSCEHLGGKRTRENFMNVAAKFLPKQKLPKLKGKQDELQIVS